MVKTSLAAAAVIALLVTGATLFSSRPSQPAVGGLSSTASASANPSHPAVVAPSATPSSTPSSLVWTETSPTEDWPAPVRAEPAGGALVLPFPETTLDANGEPHGQYTDPSGDTGSPDFPWVDIQEVAGPGDFGLVSNQPPVVDPTDQWIAYGAVLDDDDDGVPDRRMGMDNMPDDATGEQHRVWVTDLHTGRSESVGPPNYPFIGDSWWVGDSYYPPGPYGSDVQINIGFDRPGQPRQDVPFYVWASVIQDGLVVATDYAPDVGWLVDPIEGSPGPTPRVEGSPGPTPQVEDDPGVPGGRLWTVTVANKSPRPATLFVAEEDATGMGRLVGTVSPSVVPPGAIVKVTFALPAKGVTGWWIFVNPEPASGALLGSTEAPLAGEIHITPDGKAGWLSP